MLDSLMSFYSRLPMRLQKSVRHWLVMPGKRILSHGVIRQDGFLLAKRLDQTITFKVWRQGNYEPNLAALLRAYLRPGDTFIDVGANIGYFTLLATACVGPTGHVHSFEPNPRVFIELTRNIALNRFSQAVPNNIALADQAGTVQLYIAPEMDSGLTSMRRTSALLTETQTVSAMTLDAYIASRQVAPVRMMKIDVEGAEHLVLKGATTFLASSNRPAVLALESVAAHAAAFNTTTIAVARCLMDYNYELYMLDGEGTKFQLSHLHAPEAVLDGTLIGLRERI